MNRCQKSARTFTEESQNRLGLLCSTEQGLSLREKAQNSHANAKCLSSVLPMNMCTIPCTKLGSSQVFYLQIYCKVLIKTKLVIQIHDLVPWWLVILLYFVEMKTKWMIRIDDLVTCVWLQEGGAQRQLKKEQPKTQTNEVSADAAFCCVHGVIIVAELDRQRERTNWL